MTSMEQLCRDYASDSDSETPNNIRVVIVDSYPESLEEKRQLGFQRQTQHVEGHWSGHVFLPLHTSEPGDDALSMEEVVNRRSLQLLLGCATRLVDHLAERIQREAVSNAAVNVTIVPHFEYPAPSAIHDSDSDESIGHPPNKRRRPVQSSIQPISSTLHISLSKPFFLQQHNIQSFTSHLTQRIRTFQRCKQGPLLLSFQSPPSYSILFNEDPTRAYLALSPTTTGAHLVLELIRQVVDPLMTMYGFDTYRFDGKTHNSMMHNDTSEMSADRMLKVDTGNTQIHVTVASILGSDLRRLLHPFMDKNCSNDASAVASETTSPTISTAATDTTTISFLLEHVVCVLGGVHTVTIPLHI